MNMRSDELWTIDQVAATLHVNRQSVRRWWNAGKIPAPVKLGRSIRWRREQLERWLGDGCPDLSTGGADHE